MSCEHCGGHGDEEDVRELLRTFHGHLGPYVVAGYRMGRAALRMLGANKYFRVQAEVWCPETPPPSCALDGIQLSTGCTLGKQNIRHYPSADGVVLRLTNLDNDQQVTLRLRPEAMAAAAVGMKERGDEGGVAALDALRDEELLEQV
ncbi:MAG: formylmethanofuran dehydrogenase subunit E family protein [Armatimonadetes bacterium]|nr:formylmethanofuran dehydrogenase subunit E family protein [Armatimonadota bacterium]